MNRNGVVLLCILYLSRWPPCWVTCQVCGAILAEDPNPLQAVCGPTTLPMVLHHIKLYSQSWDPKLGILWFIPPFQLNWVLYVFSYDLLPHFWVPLAIGLYEFPYLHS